MNMHRNRLLLALLALLAVYASPLRADTNPPNSTFFSPATYLGDDSDDNPVYYLDYFDTFTYDPTDQTYVYKYNFGWLYDFGGSDTDATDVYLYDFVEDDVLYTSSDLYPYIYSFNLNTFLYYFEGSQPREFYNFDTDSYFSY